MLQQHSSLVGTRREYCVEYAVFGIDISIAELTSKLPKGEQLYGIIVDHNGILIYHPKLVLPKTEVHCVRRSACYDASQVHHRAGAGLRVQYGFSDQRVYRLVGLIDSIPTIDLMEVEGNSLAVRNLRTHILEQNCPEEPIVEGDREFYCANLADSPFSVIIVNSANRQSLIYTEKTDTVETVRTPLISYFLSRRDLCRWALDFLPANRRFDGLLSITNCDNDLSMTRSMINSVKTWAESWHNQGSSTLPLKYITSKFDDELFEKDNTSDVQFSIRSDVIIAYRSIFDKYNNRLAVVGVQWRMDYLNDLFMNWTKKNEDWIQCRKVIDCLLVTRSGFVVASSTGRQPAHLASFDPQLFASLDINDMVSTYAFMNITTWVDAQAECIAKRTAPWSSPASSARNPLRVLIDTVMMLISKTFWVDIYYLMISLASAQPSMSGGICRFQRVKPVERMSKALHTTVIHLDELGEKNIVIVKKLVITMAVHRTVKLYKKFGTVEDHPRRRISRSVNTRVRKIVKNRILRDNKRLMRKLASDLSNIPTSIRRIVKHELRFNLHNIRRTHKL
uniref:SAC domain-containing protein n=1 Tax=Heterorhabditis bacteriophora TaxID=37862 RepID=A0A1I7XE74_HETBA